MLQPERFGGDHGVLGGEGDIDAGHHKVSSQGMVLELDLLGLDIRSLRVMSATQHEVERALLDVLLVAGDLGQHLALGRVGDGDRRPSCMFELVAADWAAAIRVSRVPDGTGSGRKPRTER